MFMYRIWEASVAYFHGWEKGQRPSPRLVCTEMESHLQSLCGWAVAVWAKALNTNWLSLIFSAGKPPYHKVNLSSGRFPSRSSSQVPTSQLCQSTPVLAKLLLQLPVQDILTSRGCRVVSGEDGRHDWQMQKKQACLLVCHVICLLVCFVSST